jgi:hypothetical protein
MRAIAVGAVAGCVLLSGARQLAAAEPTDACGLLTPALSKTLAQNAASKF